MAHVVNPYSLEIAEFSANHTVRRRAKTYRLLCLTFNIALWKEGDARFIKKSNESTLMSPQQRVSVAFENYYLKLFERSKRVVLSQVNDVARVSWSARVALNLEIKLN